MSYLKMALAALQATTSADEAGAQRCGYTSQAPNHTPSAEAPQASAPACPVTCAAACPWYASNPWSHDPTLLGWCQRRMEPLAAGSPASEEFRRGEVPPRQNYERVPQVQPSTSPAPQEHVLTCADCPHFEANQGPNPGQGWGKCLKRNKAGMAAPRLARRLWLLAPKRHQMLTVKIDSQAHLTGHLPGAVVDRIKADSEGKMKTYETHEAAELFPLMVGAEFQELVNSIKANGLLKPIELYEGMLLDGRNRY